MWSLAHGFYQQESIGLWAKAISSDISLSFNFTGPRFLVFPEHSSGAWKPQNMDSK